MGVIVAFAPPVHVLLDSVVGKQLFEAGSCVLAALAGVNDKSSRGPAHDRRAVRRFGHSKHSEIGQRRS